MQTEITPFLVEAGSLIDDVNAVAVDVLLVDVRPEAEYLAGHLPGAVCVPPATLISGIPPATGKLPDLERLQQLADGLGLHTGRLVIAYDAEGGGWAGRLIWTLAVLGHPNLAYLNGGLPAWVMAGGELQTGPLVAKALTKVASVRIYSKYLIDFNELLQKHRDLTVWDSRSAEEYSGEKAYSARGGHIPGAVHINWLSLFNPENGFKLMPALVEQLDEQGVHKHQDIVTYCQTHHRSGLTWLVGRLLGYTNIRAYDGSWSEWGNRPDAPIVSGREPG